MSKTQIRDFTQGNITKQLISFAWPLFLANLLQVVYNMVDMIVVGQAMGKVGTSAVSIGGDISMFLTFVAMGFSSAGQVLIAKFVGARETDKVGRFVGTMSGFLVVCSLVISAAALLCRDGILALMSTPAESWQEAANYSNVCMAGLVFITGYNMVSAILRGMGDSKHPFLFILVAALLNVALDVVFVLGFEMGAAGAALATVISQGVSFLCCTLFLIRRREQFALNVTVRNFFHWDRELLGSLVKLGVPMALKFAAIQFSRLFVNSWINSYGVVISAFAGIAAKISSTAILVSNSMNTAGSTLVGQNVAAGEFGRVRQVMLRVTTITVTIATVFCAALTLFPQTIFGLFTTDAAVLAMVPSYLPIAYLLCYSSALRAGMNALINGSGIYSINFVTAILDGIVMRIGLALLFGLALDMKHYGFWLGDALAGFTPFFVGLAFYFSGRWKKGYAGGNGAA